MEDFLKLNWRPTDFSLISSNEFIPDSSVKNSYIFKGLDNLPKVDVILIDDDPDQEYIPGLKHFKPVNQQSSLTKEQHQECLHALVLMTSSKEKLNAYDKSTLELYNTIRQKISEENERFSKYARDEWNKLSHRYIIPKVLTTYAKDVWKSNLKCAEQYPAVYKLFEAISLNYDPNDANVEMNLKMNIFDLGHVAKYIRPVFEEEILLKQVVFPLHEESNFYFKNKVSEDRNIDQMVDQNPVDIVISSGGFKKLMTVQEIHTSNWNLPVVVRKHNGKNVAFIDEPLRSPKADKLCINRKAYKDAVKLQFCANKGFSYDAMGYTIKQGSLQEDSKKDEEGPQSKFYENVAYKIWTLKKRCERNELLKSQNSGKELNVLVRSKIDACELLPNGKLQPLTIVPKLEYQTSFGGSVCSKSELISQWCSLFIRPQSILYRVRIRPDTSEIIMIETCNLHKINHESQSFHNLRPSNGFQVLYKLFHKLSALKCGKYLLHHTIADGGFASLLEETNLSAGNVYDMHEEYKSDKVIIDVPSVNPWLAIDCNLVLPAHQKLEIMPGMFARAYTVKNKRSSKQKPKPKTGGIFNRAGNTKQKPNNKRRMGLKTKSRPNASKQSDLKQV